MSEPLEIEVDATHLYPGARGRLAGRRQVLGTPVTCTLVFSDFVRATGSIRWADENGGRLDVDPYVTAAGTRIPAKAWQMSVSPQKGGLAISVQGRIDQA
jgi:hypothetical protein